MDSMKHKKETTMTSREHDLGYDLGYRIGYEKPFPQEEHEWVEEALQILADEGLNPTVFTKALYEGIEHGKRDDADTRD